MANNQLESVAQWERDKEQKCIVDFTDAQQYFSSCKQKLEGLEQYRLDYLRMAQVRASDGVKAQSYHQHHAFIGKLDKACEQQMEIVAKANAVANQRKEQWLQQQRKRKAVEMLLEKKQLEYQQRLERAEQRALDEYALQKFIRKSQW